jgi:hypothetical protein
MNSQTKTTNPVVNLLGTLLLFAAIWWGINAWVNHSAAVRSQQTHDQLDRYYTDAQSCGSAASPGYLNCLNDAASRDIRP